MMTDTSSASKTCRTASPVPPQKHYFVLLATLSDRLMAMDPIMT